LGLQRFHGEGPHRLLLARLRTARGETIKCRIHNCLYDCEIFILYTQFTNVAAGRLMQPCVGLQLPHSVRSWMGHHRFGGKGRKFDLFQILY
jgi:hypothetical protein